MEVQTIAVAVVVGAPGVLSLLSPLLTPLLTPIIASIVAVWIPRPALVLTITSDLAVLQVWISLRPLDFLRLLFRILIGVLLVLLNETLKHPLQAFSRHLIFTNRPDRR
jgi:hypothetical protein